MSVKYLVFDIEAVADGDLISRVKYPGENLSHSESINKFNQELADKHANGGPKDIIPSSFSMPCAIVVAKVDENYKLLDIVALDEPEFRSGVMTSLFWQGWSAYKQPTLVSFNGRGYDLPVLELMAYRLGLSVPDWFNIYAKTYDQARNRYNLGAHFDLADFFSNFGSSRPHGGLNLLSKLIGKPGKFGIDGSQVQSLYDQGKLSEINDYCRCDVLDTYFVFLRSLVMIGRITDTQETKIVGETQQWLVEQNKPVYDQYLKLMA